MKPQRNPRYLTWIRTQPCCVCVGASDARGVSIHLECAGDCGPIHTRLSLVLHDENVAQIDGSGYGEGSQVKSERALECPLNSPLRTMRWYPGRR